MFCGKKKRTITLETKVASDDLSQMQINLGHLQFKLDKNMGLAPTNIPHKTQNQNQKNQGKGLQELKQLEQELNKNNKKFKTMESKFKEHKKKDLIEKLKYEKVKGKLIDILQEYERTVKSIS
jgi:23S rRNA pseudoU1915 N3-methylase RlmH